MENNHSAAEMGQNLPLLITGANGFIGKNLAATLRAEGFANLLLYDINSPEGALEAYAKEAAFVFHLAGVNRPKDTAEFYTGNAGLTEQLISALQHAGSTAGLLLSSSAQVGNGSDYAKSKEEAETAVFAHAKSTGAPVFVYRLPGVFGKWSRPGYNSVVATFCHNIARGLPIEVRDLAASLPLCYIDDVVRAFIASMQSALYPGQQAPAPTEAPAREPATYTAPGQPQEKGVLGIDPTYEVTLGWLAGIIRSFPHLRETLALPNVGDACTTKLWATYLSYIPLENCAYPLKQNADARGSFTEFLRTRTNGQVAINVTRPGITRGNHWHNTKNEKFLAVSGRGVVRLRRLGEADIVLYEVDGDTPQVVEIPPGCAHNIENTGADNLVTVMWASEPFNPDVPDTYYEQV